MVVVGTLLALACFFNSIVSTMWMFVIGFFFIRLLGQGSMTLIPNTLVAQWFIEKRGRAVSFISLGSFASAMLFPVINAWLIEAWSWEFAWRFWGVALLIIFVPFALFGVRNRPEDMGFVPDGFVKQQDKNDETLAHKISHVAAEVNWQLNEAIKTRAFWMILICIGIPSMINTGITFHIISIFAFHDLGSGIAATVLSLMAMVGIPMSLLSGFITEKMKTNYLFVWIFVIEIILLLLLLVLVNATVAIIIGVLWGVANGFNRIATNVIWPDYFGRKYIGSINGVGATMMVVASAFGPLPFGYGYDLFESYTPVLLISLIFPVIGLIASLLATKPTQQEA
ncbi:major facilitator superfamily protein [Gracilibacillus halophilus YIM-C55.5]|uniref:Major facilitator superfamily protein n=2 Tax=Gracilibacillus TaxID=74385 RepID=N4W993_9BACI|nr:major facilitator superfamily protein [Gracilibacillus halophilus YIM-C55.5]